MRNKSIGRMAISLWLLLTILGCFGVPVGLAQDYQTQGTRKPATCSDNRQVFYLTGDDGANLKGYYKCENGSFVPVTIPSQNGLITTSDPRLNASVNVKASPYGAVGDGVANDTTALQAGFNALDWAKGGVIVIPPGHYKITAPITLPRAAQFGVYSSVIVYAHGAVFEPTSAASSVFSYHATSQAINDEVIYNSLHFIGGQFKAATRTAGQTAFVISSCEGCRFQDIDFFNINAIDGRTFYRTIIEGNNINVDNEFGIKLNSGDWSGANSLNSPSNANIIRNNRIIPGAGSHANIWLINSDLTGIEGPSISEGWDATLYPGSGNPEYEILIDNSGYAFGQTNWVRGCYSERPSLPSVAVIGAKLNNGTLDLDLIRRYDDTTGVVYVDATGSTGSSQITLHNWPRIDASPTPRFKTAVGVQWNFQQVGAGVSPYLFNPAWWVSGSAGYGSLWNRYGIIINPGPTEIPAYQLGSLGAVGAEAAFGLARGPEDWFAGAVAGDTAIRSLHRDKSICFSFGDGTVGTDGPALCLDAGGADARGSTGLSIFEQGTKRRILIGEDGTGPGGDGRALYLDSGLGGPPPLSPSRR